MYKIWVWFLGQDSLEEEMATHSSIPAWGIPWTEEPGGPHSMDRNESDATECVHTYTQFPKLTSLVSLFTHLLCARDILWNHETCNRLGVWYRVCLAPSVWVLSERATSPQSQNLPRDIVVCWCLQDKGLNAGPHGATRIILPAE